jgi:protein SCO1/2
MHGLAPGWTFLTGKPADIEMLRQKLGFTTPNPATDKDTSQHIGNVRYGNEPLMLWGACPGSSSPKFMIELISRVIQPEANPRKA